MSSNELKTVLVLLGYRNRENAFYTWSVFKGEKIVSYNAKPLHYIVGKGYKTNWFYIPKDVLIHLEKL